MNSIFILLSFGYEGDDSILMICRSYEEVIETAIKEYHNISLLMLEEWEYNQKQPKNTWQRSKYCDGKWNGKWKQITNNYQYVYDCNI